MSHTFDLSVSLAHINFFQFPVKQTLLTLPGPALHTDSRLQCAEANSPADSPLQPALPLEARLSLHFPGCPSAHTATTCTEKAANGMELQLKKHSLTVFSKNAKQQRSRYKSLLTIPAMISRLTGVKLILPE